MSINEMFRYIGMRNDIDMFCAITYEPTDDSIGEYSLFCEPRNQFEIKPNELYETEIGDLTKKYCAGEREAIAILSTVWANGKELHIPQIDFRCEVSPEYLTKIADFLEAKGVPKGFVLDSGNSYHFYGDNLMIDDKWSRFMRRLNRDPEHLVVSPEAELSWPDLCIGFGYSDLRISACISRNHEPNVIMKVGGMVMPYIFMPRQTHFDFVKQKKH